jgi:hypothetical protein
MRQTVIGVSVAATILFCLTSQSARADFSTSGETVQLRPQQQALVRDGQPALVSRQKTSLVLVPPASRQFHANGRPVFVVGINNPGRDLN